MQLFSILERAEALWPAREAAPGLDYRALAQRVRALAAGLANLGVARGERVAILEINSLAYLEAYFAVAGLGAVLVPLNLRSTARELALVLTDAGARWLVARAEFAATVAEVRERAPVLERVVWIDDPAEAAPEDGSYARFLSAPSALVEPVRAADDELAQLYYTSGTTGRPKGVMLSHGNVSTHALCAIAELGLSDADTWAHVAPMFHLADAWATFAVTWVGGRHVFAPRFEELAVLDLLERERVTLTNLVPTMLNRLVRVAGVELRDWSSLRRLLSGGASIAPEIVRRIMAVFRCEYVQTYGMTETSPFLTLSLLKEHLTRLSPAEQFAFRAKTGRPFLGVELKVVDESGAPVANDARAVGEIRVRGATVTRGYWNRPEETTAAFREGWLCTGDLATIDGEGYVQIVDRQKDLINTGGEKVYSTEVESALFEHPAVLEAAVFAVADPLWGESVRAAIVLRAGARAQADELARHCRERLAGYKIPRAFVFVDDLPKTGSGKIQKSVLRERFSALARPT